MGWEATPVFEDNAEFTCRMDQVTRVPETDHTRLHNRDAPEQHPIEAITGLSGELGARLTESDALTNLEIESLLGG